MKLQKIGLAVCSLIMGLSMTMTVYAAESDLQLTLDQNGSFYYTSNNQVQDGKINLGEMFRGIAPGETRTATTTLTNDCAYADFYISTETLDTFEKQGEEGGATNGYYDVQLSVTKNGKTAFIYDTTLGGYTGNTTESAYGLLELNDNLDSYVYLTTLDQNEAAVVTFSITLDGETVGNSYSSKDAVVDFDYQAVYKATNVVTVVEDASVNTVERKKTEYVTATTTILDDNVALIGVPSGVAAAKTNDTVEIYIYGALLVIALFVFALTFKKNKKNSVTIIFAVLLAGTISSTVYAETTDTAVDSQTKTFLITYRSGTMGTFDIENYTLTGACGYEILEANAYYVTIRVNDGAKYPACPDVVVSDELYEVNQSFLGTYNGNNGSVKQNQEVVVDYTRLTNPVSYSVTYKTNEGVVLGTKTGRGNVDETIDLAKNFVGYRVDSSVTSIKLSSDSNKNCLDIIYVVDSALNTGTQYQYVSGGTTTVYNDVTEYVYIPGTTTVLNGTNGGMFSMLTPGTIIGGDMGGFSVTQNNTQNAGLGNGNGAAIFNPDNMIADNTQNQNDDNVGGDNQNEDLISIDDQQTPLEETIDGTSTTETKDSMSETKETEGQVDKESWTSIDDDDVPKTDTISLIKEHYILVIMVVVLLILIISTAFVFSKKGKKKCKNK